MEFYNQFNKFDPNTPIAVTYDPITNILTYRQLTRIVMTSGIRHMYLQGKLKLGIITPRDYGALLLNLSNVITKGILEDHYCMVSMDKFKLRIYKTYTETNLLSGPQLFTEIDFVPIRLTFLSKLILKNYSGESATLLKLIKNEHARKQYERKGDTKSSSSEGESDKSE